MTKALHLGPFGEGWHAVHIGAARRVDGFRYAMIVNRESGEATIAAPVTIAEALVIALELGDKCGAAMFYRDRGERREHVIGRRRSDTGVFEPVLSASVGRTARIATDHVSALEFFEDVMEHDPRVFFDGRLVKICQTART
jgi:hypothetical protein